MESLNGGYKETGNNLPQFENVLQFNYTILYCKETSTTMAPDFTAIANQAEADLNTYQAKTGAARAQGLDQAGINSMAEKKFEDRGAQVTQGDELSTNASFNKRIPPSEGGVLDDKGRYVTIIAPNHQSHMRIIG